MASPTFSSAQEARNAYYGDDAGGGGGGGGSDGGGGGGSDTAEGRWGELVEEPTSWSAGWALWYQEDQDQPGRRRWFVLRPQQNGEGFDALNLSGKVEEFDPDASLDEVPHSTDEQAMRDAYQAWIDEQPDDGPPESEAWGEWQRMQQVGEWWVWVREHENEDRMQFLIAGVQQDDTAVYLHPDGTIQESAHIYDDAEAVQSALDTYFQRQEEGDVPEGDRPTGNSPTREQIKKDAAESGADDGSGSPLGGDLVTPRNLAIAGGAVGALYLANESGALDELVDGAGGGA